MTSHSRAQMLRGGAMVTFTTGQPVRWPPAPDQLAQIDELRRTTVRVLYATKTGRLRRPIVRAAELGQLQRDVPPVLPIHNLFGRGILRRHSKSFAMEGASDEPQANCD